MSKVVTTSAPGKLLLTGEYAVLENAPAVSAATDLRATVEIYSVNTKSSELYVVNTECRYSFNPDLVGASRWINDPGEYGAIVDAALDVMHEHGLHPDQGSAMGISICTRDFYQQPENINDAPQKKGIGSSAAVAAALTAALQVVAGKDPDMGMALQVHRRFQGERGSGVDVVTSWFGGLIAMLPGQPSTSMPVPIPRVQELSWPEALYVMPIWTGQSASTTAKLSLLNAYKEDSPDAWEKVFEPVCAAATVAAAAWENGVGSEILESIHQFSESLRQLDAAASLGIWSEPHQQLYSFTNQSDVVYKPSGAGGGDFGIAFATDKSQLLRFATQAEEAGFATNTVAWGHEGLNISRH
jgi:phosphomevalonate kinase